MATGSQANAFSPDSLPANRRGELTERQRQGFGALAASNHRSNYGSAALAAAAAVLIGFFASPSASMGLRVMLTAGAAGLAIVLVVRSVAGLDAVTRDVRAGRVDMAEGAIGKRRISNRGGPAATAHFLHVGAQRFSVSPGTFRDAPDAGHVRVFFLPRSRKIVNLESLPNPVPADLNEPRLQEAMKESYRSHDVEQSNEARATLASVVNAWEASVTPGDVKPPASRDGRPLEQAIVGDWTNGVINVTFAADGAVTIRMFGTTRNGRWSVDRNGQLSADIAGRQGAVDAWIADDKLTINLDGSGMTLARDAKG